MLTNPGKGPAMSVFWEFLFLTPLPQLENKPLDKKKMSAGQHFSSSSQCNTYTDVFVGPLSFLMFGYNKSPGVNIFTILSFLGHIFSVLRSIC